MAGAITKAKNELIRLNNRARNERLKRREESAQITQSACVLAGGALAALVDERFGGGDEVAELADGIPTNAVVGSAAVAAAALVKGVPMRRELASVGLGMASCALYQLIRERVDLSPSA